MHCFRNDWQKFEPYTNILWLHYVLDKMVTVLRYRYRTTKVHAGYLKELRELRKVILNYPSTTNFVKSVLMDDTEE